MKNSQEEKRFSRDCSNPERRLTPDDVDIMARMAPETRGSYWYGDVRGWSVMTAAESLREQYPALERNNARAVHGLRSPDGVREVLP